MLINTRTSSFRKRSIYSSIQSLCGGESSACAVTTRRNLTIQWKRDCAIVRWKGQKTVQFCVTLQVSLSREGSNRTFPDFGRYTISGRCSICFPSSLPPHFLLLLSHLEMRVSISKWWMSAEIRVRERTRDNGKWRETREERGMFEWKGGTVPENHKESGRRTLSRDWSGLDPIQSDAS